MNTSKAKFDSILEKANKKLAYIYIQEQIQEASNDDISKSIEISGDIITYKKVISVLKSAIEIEKEHGTVAAIEELMSGHLQASQNILKSRIDSNGLVAIKTLEAYIFIFQNLRGLTHLV